MTSSKRVSDVRLFSVDTAFISNRKENKDEVKISLLQHVF